MTRLEGRYEDRFFPRVSPLDAKSCRGTGELDEEGNLVDLLDFQLDNMYMKS